MSIFIDCPQNLMVVRSRHMTPEWTPKEIDDEGWREWDFPVGPLVYIYGPHLHQKPLWRLGVDDMRERVMSGGATVAR